jgi:phage-related protein
MALKSVVFLEGEIRTPPFTSQARVEAGVLLRRLQEGEALSMPHSKPMPSIGNGCHELRIRDEAANWRIAYYVDEDAIVILAVWKKKTQKTPPHVIESCKRRLRRFLSA